MSAETVENVQVLGEGLPPGTAVRFWSPRRVLILLLVSGLVLTAVRVLFVQSFVVPTASMSPTLAVDDRVLVSSWDYRVGDVQRGDVIVFDGDGTLDQTSAAKTGLAAAGRAVAAALGSPVGESDHVSRVIGLPGEQIACCDVSERITVDGRPLAEVSLGRAAAVAPSFTVRVPTGYVWVMGDNRSAPVDHSSVTSGSVTSGSVTSGSRNPGAGAGAQGGVMVPLDHVVGRLVARWWPSGSVIGRPADALGNQRETAR